MAEALKPLEGKVAIVAGATRAAGRGIACMLGAAGATVYCSGRSTRGQPATPGRPETIEETAEMVIRHGGMGVPCRCDHSKEESVKALVARVRSDHGRLDILVNDIWGGDEIIKWDQKLWDLDVDLVRRLYDQAVMTHLITSRHAAPLMLETGRGLIAEITDGELAGYRGQLLYDLVKSSVNRLAYGMAWELRGTGVTALAVSPGFLRSEAMLDRFGVTEANWRDGVAKDPFFAESETPFFVGRAVAALAGDPDVADKAGGTYFAADLAREYGFTDVDGRVPAFWPKVEGYLEEAWAKGELEPAAADLALHRYRMIHLTPAKAAQARRYAERLQLTDLGDGQRPVV